MKNQRPKLERLKSEFEIKNLGYKNFSLQGTVRDSFGYSRTFLKKKVNFELLRLRHLKVKIPTAWGLS